MVFEVRTEGFYIRHLNIYVFYYISYFYFQSDHFIIGTDIFRELRNEEKIQDKYSISENEELYFRNNNEC